MIGLAVLYGVRIYPPDPEHPCAMCVEALATAIEEACADAPDLPILPREEKDWSAVARNGRINLCDTCLSALRRTLMAPDAPRDEVNGG